MSLNVIRNSPILISYIKGNEAYNSHNPEREADVKGSRCIEMSLPGIIQKRNPELKSGRKQGQTAANRCMKDSPKARSVNRPKKSRDQVQIGNDTSQRAGAIRDYI